MEGVPPWEQQGCSSREKAEQHKESGHVGTIDRLVHCIIGENRVVASLSTHTHDSSHSAPNTILGIQISERSFASSDGGRLVSINKTNDRTEPALLRCSSGSLSSR